MEDRNHRLCRLFLKRKMRRLRRKGELDAANQIATVLGDELMLCALCCEAEDLADETTFAAPGFPFLRLLFENWPAILELIKTLIELFSIEDET
jgi:hypothetical protein